MLGRYAFLARHRIVHGLLRTVLNWHVDGQAVAWPRWIVVLEALGHLKVACNVVVLTLEVEYGTVFHLSRGVSAGVDRTL